MILKKNKIIKESFITLLIFTLLLLVPINAYGLEMKNGQTVDFNKTWNIKFNEEISFDDLTQNEIKVKDNYGNVINTKLALGQDKKSILVQPPINGYKPGEKYILYIGNKIHSKKNKNLSNSMVMNFNIKNTEVDTSDYVQDYINTDKIFSSTINYSAIKGDGYFEGQSEETIRKYYSYYNIHSTIFFYNKSLSEAMYTGDFSNIEDYFNKDSKLYNDQKKLVQDSFSKNSTEEFVDCIVLDYSYNVKKNLYKVNVIEKYNSITENNTAKIKTYNKQYIIDGEYAENSILDIQTKEVKEENVLKQYGYINKIYERDGKKFLDINLVDFLFGDEAVKAAKEDGYLDVDEYILDNDYYIRDNNETKTFEISDLASFEDIRSTEIENIDFYDLEYYVNYENPFVSITTQNNNIVNVRLEYIP